MNDIFVVMKYTMKEMIRRKSFIVSSIIILLMIIIGFNIPNIIKIFDGDGNASKIAILDKNNIYEGTLNVLNESNEYYEYIITDEDIETIKEKITNGDYDSAIILNKENNNIEMNYIVENIFFSDGLPRDISDTLVNLYKYNEINKLNLTDEEKLLINPTFSYNIEQVTEEANGNVLIMMLISIVLFYAIYFCAYQVSSSITTEKTSKIIETLVTSTSPKNIVIGKTVGIGFVGLIQLFAYIVVAYICANSFMDKELLEMVLDTSSLTLGLLVITLLYFVLGYAVYAFLYALTGSTVSKPEDINSANTPISLICVVGFYLSYFTMMNPTSNLNLLASLLPISSAFCMPLRIMMGVTNYKEIIISLLILLVTVVVIAKISIKIYSSAILNTGNKLSFKDLVNITKER